jgi:hypothetical protein
MWDCKNYFSKDPILTVMGEKKKKKKRKNQPTLVDACGWLIINT